MNTQPHCFKGVNENMLKQEKKKLVSVPRDSIPVTTVYTLYNEP